MNWLVSIARNEMMKMTFKVFIVFLLFCGQSLAQDNSAALLPNAKQTFVNQNGQPYNGGKVYFYIPGTDTLKSTWQDADKNVVNTNPVILDAAGRAIIYGDGEYRQVLRDRNNNLIWDQLTSSTGTGGGSTATGDGDLVGTIKPWAGLTAPNQYLFSYGQEIARVTYPELFTAITFQTSAFCTITSPILTGIADTSQIPIGSAVEAACVASGSTVLSKTSSTVTLTNNATISTSLVATFLPWGGGNGITTFNLPDLRGRVIAGRDNMGGTAASRLTTTYFANANAVGAAGGSQSQTLAQTNLPAIAPTGTVNITDTGHVHSSLASGGVATNARQRTVYDTTSSGSAIHFDAGSPNQISTNSATTGVTAAFVGANLGSSTPFSVVQPTITSNYIIKVTPDTNSSSATGVLSLGGMTGVIACGSGILCTGNTISLGGGLIPSTDVSFIQSGTGAILRTGQDKLREQRSVFDFGAVCDGSNDDTATMQLALNSMAPGEELQFWGRCRITNRLTFSVPSVQLKGIGYTLLHTPSEIYGSQIFVDFSPSTAASALYITADGVILQDFEMLTTQPLPTSGAWVPATTPWMIHGYRAPFVTKGGNDIKIRNIGIWNATHGIWMDGNYRASIDGIYGQIFQEGIKLDEQFDALRIQNVHLFPYWAASVATNQTEFNYVMDFQVANMVFMAFGRVDNPLISNIFAYGNATGIVFNEGATPSSVSRAKFSNIDLDLTQTGLFINSIGATANFSNFSTSSPQTYSLPNSRGIFCNPSVATFAYIQFSNTRLSAYDYGIQCGDNGNLNTLNFDQLYIDQYDYQNTGANAILTQNNSIVNVTGAQSYTLFAGSSGAVYSGTGVHLSGYITQLSTTNFTVNDNLDVRGLRIANNAGLAATPSYTFLSYPTSGMWAPASSSIAFSVNGSEVARLGSGCTALYKTSCTEALEVSGSIRSQTSGNGSLTLLPGTGATNTGYIDFRNNAGTRYAALGNGIGNLSLTLENGAQFNISGGVVTLDAAPILTTLTGYLYGNGASAVTASTTIPANVLSGTIDCARMPALTGDLTSSACATTLATVNSNVGVFGSSTAIPTITVNAKGLITAISTNVVIAPAGTLSGATLASNVLASSLTSVGDLSALTLNTYAVSGDWTAYTPVFSCGTGSVSTNGPTPTGYYKRIGKTVFFSVNIFMPAGYTGTCAFPTATLPFTSNGASGAMVPGRNNRTGAAYTAIVGGAATTVTLNMYDGTGVIAANDNFYITGEFWAQ